MPNDPFYIICPYYHKVIGNTIFCDCFSGDDKFLTDECHIKQCFQTREMRNNFIKKYCSGFDFSSCSIARINSIFISSKKKN